MKLPGYTPGGVPSLSTVNPNAYRAKGQAMQNMANAVSGAAQQAGEAISLHREREALVDMSNSMTDFRTRWGNKRTLSEADLEELGITPTDEQRFREYTDDAGMVQKEERSEFEAEEFYGDALERKWQATAELAAKKIPTPGARQRFMMRQTEMINKSREVETSRAQKIREAKQVTRYETDIENARISGNYALAKGLIMEHPVLDPEQKRKEVQKNYQDEEKHMLQQVMWDEAPRDERGELIMSEVPIYQEKLERQIERLESSIYGGDKEGDRMNSLDVDQRRAMIQRLRAAQKAVKGDSEAAKARNLAGWYRDFYAEMDDPESTRMDGLEQLDRAVDAGILKAADVTRVRKYVDDVKGGGAIETRKADASLSFVELDNLPVEQLAQLDREGLVDKLAGELPPADIRHLKGKARDGTGNQSDWKENVDYAEAELGFILPKKANDKEKAAYAQQQVQIRQLIYGEFRRFTETNGHAPDASARQEITDRLLMTQVRERKSRLFRDDIYVNRDYSLADIPHTEYNRITQVLQASGDTQPTARDYHAVNDVLTKLDKMGLDNPTTEQVVEAARLLENNMPLGQWVKQQRRVTDE